MHSFCSVQLAHPHTLATCRRRLAARDRSGQALCGLASARHFRASGGKLSQPQQAAGARHAHPCRTGRLRLDVYTGYDAYTLSWLLSHIVLVGACSQHISMGLALGEDDPAMSVALVKFADPAAPPPATWAWDDYRPCRAIQFVPADPESLYVTTTVPCDWPLPYICMLESDALSLGFTVRAARLHGLRLLVESVPLRTSRVLHRPGFHTLAGRAAGSPRAAQPLRARPAVLGPGPGPLQPRPGRSGAASQPVRELGR